MMRGCSKLWFSLEYATTSTIAATAHHHHNTPSPPQHPITTTTCHHHYKYYHRCSLCTGVSLQKYPITSTIPPHHHYNNPCGTPPLLQYLISTTTGVFTPHYATITATPHHYHNAPSLPQRPITTTTPRHRPQYPPPPSLPQHLVTITTIPHTTTQYFSAFRHRDRFDQVLSNWVSHNVQIIVVTDGGRILGLGGMLGWWCWCAERTVPSNTHTSQIWVPMGWASASAKCPCTWLAQAFTQNTACQWCLIWAPTTSNYWVTSFIWVKRCHA